MARNGMTFIAHFNQFDAHSIHTNGKWTEVSLLGNLVKVCTANTHTHTHPHTESINTWFIWSYHVVYLIWSKCWSWKCHQVYIQTQLPHGRMKRTNIKHRIRTNTRRFIKAVCYHRLSQEFILSICNIQTKCHILPRIATTHTRINFLTFPLSASETFLLICSFIIIFDNVCTPNTSAPSYFFLFFSHPPNMTCCYLL